ncbi:GNAT family N-acetyltransferase [Paludibaculum fermentans]|uniref:GNAT family N-acetyltransferase n=1 Tax=Paludibaculum fermentans TaxID=1473598 RepID=UPI003EB7C362
MSLMVTVWRTEEAARAQYVPFLREQAPGPFQCAGWLHHYWDSIRRPQGARAFFIGVFRAGEMVAFAPFALTKLGGGVTRLGFATDGRADRQGIAGECSAEVLAAVRDALRAAPQPLVADWRELADGDPLLTLLPGAETMTVQGCPYRVLTPGTAEASKSNKKFQQRIPSYERRLNALGPYEFRTIDCDTQRAEALELLPRLFEIHDLRHAAKRNAWKKDSNREFLLSLLRDELPSHLMAFVSYVDGVPVAFDLGFRHGSTFTLYIPAFHPAFEKYRLGHVNRARSYEACLRMGLELYDFSRGRSFAKQVWAHGEVLSYDCIAPVGGSWRARLAARLLSGSRRLIAWSRAQGYNQKLGAWREKLVRPAAQKPAPAAALAWAGARPLRYRLIQDLPVDVMTRLAEYVFALERNAGLELEWTDSCTLRVSNQEAEPLMLHLPGATGNLQETALARR